MQQTLANMGVGRRVQAGLSPWIYEFGILLLTYELFSRNMFFFSLRSW